MEVEDLTIGNYYKAGIEFRGSIEAKLLMFSKKRVFQLTKENLVVIIDCNLEGFVYAIPIDDDWVTKFCSDSKEDGAIYHRYYVSDTEYYVLSMNDVYTFYESGHVIRDIEYAHQLQDLIRMLTGKEAELRNNYGLI